LRYCGDKVMHPL